MAVLQVVTLYTGDSVAIDSSSDGVLQCRCCIYDAVMVTERGRVVRIFQLRLTVFAATVLFH